MSTGSLLFGNELRIAVAASLALLSEVAAGAEKLNQTCHASNQAAMRLIDEERASEAVAFLSETIQQLGDPAEDKFCKGILLLNLAIAKYLLGGQNAAERAAEESLAFMEQAVGSKAVELRLPLQVLANFALRGNKLKRADELIGRLESLPWERHWDLAVSHGLRANLFARAEKKADAEREFRTAISEWELVNNKNLPLEIVRYFWDLAVLYLNDKKGAKAMPLLKRGLEIAEASSPPNLEPRVRMLLGLGIAYSRAADYESAERSFQRAMQLIDSLPPVFRSSLGQILYTQYSLCLSHLGRKREAKELRGRGETLYGRDRSGMTVSIDSLLPKAKRR
jgi:tetratricopeptide (TPR) repeat protein